MKTEKGFKVISGTRYPYNVGNSNLKDSSSKRYVLLKAISKYLYISHKELRVEHKQFEDMLRELLSAGLIKNNNLSNTYGANAYDCTPIGDEFVNKTNKSNLIEFLNAAAATAGTFTGAVLLQIYDVA